MPPLLTAFSAGGFANTHIRALAPLTRASPDAHARLPPQVPVFHFEFSPQASRKHRGQGGGGGGGGGGGVDLDLADLGGARGAGDSVGEAGKEGGAGGPVGPEVLADDTDWARAFADWDSGHEERHGHQLRTLLHRLHGDYTMAHGEDSRRRALNQMLAGLLELSMLSANMGEVNRSEAVACLADMLETTTKGNRGASGGSTGRGAGGVGSGAAAEGASASGVSAGTAATADGAANGGAASAAAGGGRIARTYSRGAAAASPVVARPGHNTIAAAAGGRGGPSSVESGRAGGGGGSTESLMAAVGGLEVLWAVVDAATRVGSRIHSVGGALRFVRAAKKFNRKLKRVSLVGSGSGCRGGRRDGRFMADTMADRLRNLDVLGKLSRFTAAYLGFGKYTGHAAAGMYGGGGASMDKGDTMEGRERGENGNGGSNGSGVGGMSSMAEKNIKRTARFIRPESQVRGQ